MDRNTAWCRRPDNGNGVAVSVLLYEAKQACFSLLMLTMNLIFFTYLHKLSAADKIYIRKKFKTERNAEQCGYRMIVTW